MLLGVAEEEVHLKLEKVLPVVPTIMQLVETEQNGQMVMVLGGLLVVAEVQLAVELFIAKVVLVVVVEVLVLILLVVLVLSILVVAEAVVQLLPQQVAVVVLESSLLDTRLLN